VVSPVGNGRAPTDAPLLELVGVRAAYGGIEVLHGVDLAVPRGAVVALLGANGAGKSTTVKVAAGLLPPTTGKVYVAGRDVTGASCHDLARIGICTIPEGRGVFPNLTVRENLWMATQVSGRLDSLEEGAYARFPLLGERRTQLAGSLSGGEQQMLALSRALVTDPAVLVLDELSMGLAPIVVGQLYESVAEIAASGVSVLVVEQFATIGLEYASYMYVMTHGVIRYRGTSDGAVDAVHAAYLGASA
jgi:branched-chain amino acid transport system ATP-binding protein